MKDEDKSRDQLIRELENLRQQNSQLKASINGISFQTNQLLEEIDYPNNKQYQSNVELCATIKELEIQREWFRVTLSSIGDAVIATDTRSNVTFMNSVAEELTGYDEAIGKNIKEVFNIYNEFTLEPAEIPVNRVIKEGFVIGLANHTGLISKTGEKRSIADSAAPIKDNTGEIIGVVMVFRDITETNRLEDKIIRLDKLHMVGQLAAGIAHEIRNPMTTVRGFLQLLSKNKECKSYREYFTLMIEELDRSNSIIKGFLSLAKDSSTKREMLNLNSIINNISPLIQADAIVDNKYVILELGDIPDIKLDESDMRQLLLNLTRNGLEAMPPRSNLTIKTYTEGETVVLLIKDSGKGITPDLLGKIKTPFFTTKENGTGLGLSICQSIADRHNAAIEVETGDTGTTFYIRFTPAIK